VRVRVGWSSVMLVVRHMNVMQLLLPMQSVQIVAVKVISNGWGSVRTWLVEFNL
jgi:hypothetical protein